MKLGISYVSSCRGTSTCKIEEWKNSTKLYLPATDLQWYLTEPVDHHTLYDGTRPHILSGVGKLGGLLQ